MRKTGLLGSLYLVFGGLGLFGIACLTGNLGALVFSALFVSIGSIGVTRWETR